MKELAERAVNAKGWRWMPGMLSSDTGLRLDEFTLEKDWEAKYPDLTDPATLGCLLTLVREALSYEHVWIARDCVVDPLDDDEYIVGKRGGWTVWGASHDEFVKTCGSGSTEAEALVAALEAAE